MEKRAPHIEGLPREECGPLLGLHGVLPAIPGAAIPSGKPKAQSLTLEVTERHGSQAKLLEGLLEAETQPLPLKGTGQAGSQRALRWAVASILGITLAGAVGTKSRLFPLPAAVPMESIAAIQAVESLQPDALVLAVFDYQSATVGEMEAAASSLMDHLLLLKHPRLSYGPDLMVGYTPAYRASSETGLGKWALESIELNQDHWGADHCIDSTAVPGVFFSSAGLGGRKPPSFRDIPRLVLGKDIEQDQSPPPPPSTTAGEDQEILEDRLKGLGYL